MVGNDLKVYQSGEVVGTFHYVTGFTGFSSEPEEQAGYYFPFHLTKSGTKMTFKKNGSTSKENIPFEKNNVFRITKTVKFEVLVDNESVVIFNFANAIFE